MDRNEQDSALGIWSRLTRILANVFGSRTHAIDRRPRTRKFVHARRTFGSFEGLERREVFAVTYHGGGVLSNAEVQGVYLGADWNNSLASTKSSLDAYLNYLVASPYFDTLHNTYSLANTPINRGTSTTGQVVGANVASGTTVTESQIKSMIQSAINSGVLATPDSERLYVIYVAKGVVIRDSSGDSSVNAFLGYHGAFAGHDANGQSADIHFAIIAYPGGPNPSSGSQGFGSDFAQMTSVSSHEIAEAVTDPNVNYKGLGWYDDVKNGEIGDLTSRTAVLNGYTVQLFVNQNDVAVALTNVTPPTSTAVTAPQNLVASNVLGNSVTLSWTSVTNATGIRIYRVDGSTLTLLTTVSGTATTATISGLTAGSSVTFRVEAYNSTSVADSTNLAVTLANSPTPVGNIAAPVVAVTATTSSSVMLSWNPAAGAEGYEIYIAMNGRWVALGAVDAATTTVRVVNLASGTNYTFLVQSFAGNVFANSAMVTTFTKPAANFPWWWWLFVNG